MIHTVNCLSNQFVCLIEKPHAWKVLMAVSSNVVKNDVINYIEVDSLSVPTGNSCSGIVKYVSNCDEIINNNSSVWCYCDVVSVVIGEAEIGVNLVVG